MTLGEERTYIDRMAETFLTRLLGSKRERDLKELVPLVRLEDRVKVPFGLGLTCHAHKR